MKYNLNVSTENGTEMVKLPSKYKMDFVKRFGVVTIPDKGAFEFWLTAIEAYQTVSEYEKSFEEFLKEMKHEEINSTS
jgi:hypothetical protein